MNTPATRRGPLQKHEITPRLYAATAGLGAAMAEYELAKNEAIELAGKRVDDWTRPRLVTD